MTEEDETMERYGITRETNTTFHFAGHKYQRLEDAVNYAKSHQRELAPKRDKPQSKS